MRFCFIIEEQFKNESMPMAIAGQLRRWRHTVDLFEPHASIVRLSDLVGQDYDAYVLKTVSNGPGLTLLEAAEAVGLPTINNSRAIRLVRDKAVAAAFAHAHGLPIPTTYFVAYPHLLEQIPFDHYPLVVKPTNGSCCRGIYRIETPTDLAALEMEDTKGTFFLAQPYIENSGYDIKIYVTGTEAYAVAKRSPLHPEVKVSKRLIPITPQMRALALRVGELFGLDIYGLDVVETPDGPVMIDINDFPSFGLVPGAVARVSMHILHVAERLQAGRTGVLNGLYPLNGHLNGHTLSPMAAL